MGTTRTYNDMLNEYLTPELLKEELIKRNYILKTVEKKDDWKGGNLVVPFKAAGASSVKFGGLTDTTDVAESSYIRGNVSSQIELWATLKLNQRDLMEHDGKIPETTFLRLIPDEIDGLMNYMKEVVSIGLYSGPHFAKALGDGQAGGTVVVSNIDRFQLGQKVILDDDNSAIQTAYVTAWDVNTGKVAGVPSSGTITLSATRGGSALDISAYTTAQTAKFYHDGSWDGTTALAFTSMKSAFLSATNGGSSTLHGKTKASYPILQATNVSGASMTSTSVMSTIFDTYNTVRATGRGNATDVLLSYKHLASCMKVIEAQKGPYRVTKESSTNIYGWTEIEITSVNGTLKLVAAQEFDDDVIIFVDWSSLCFYSNGGFKKRTAPDGKQYYEVRATTGYTYYTDLCFFGEMVYAKPSSNAIIYAIPAYTS